MGHRCWAGTYLVFCRHPAYASFISAASICVLSVQHRQIIPQTGLALMGFSRYCPSSLALTNFVVREPPRSHGGATAEECSSRSKSTQAWPRPGSRNLTIWGTGNPEIWDPKNQKIKDLRIQIRSAQNVGKVWISWKKTSWPHLGPSQAIFSMDRKNAKNVKKNAYFPWWAIGPLFTRFGT